MSKVIMVACDLHDRTMALRAALGRDDSQRRTFPNTSEGRAAMLTWMRQWQASVGAERILFVYEASCLGFGLHDELTAAGIECRVLAPSLIGRSPKEQKSKTDDKDAQLLLDVLKAHVLAGKELPAVWVPTREQRDDREVVRMRLTAGAQWTRIKAQIQTLLKRNNLRRPQNLPTGWSRLFYHWLDKDLCGQENSPLLPGAQQSLQSLLRQYTFLEQEVRRLDKEVARLSQEPRYRCVAERLQQEVGVGLLTTMVFLTELGDLTRFANRRELAAYLGLVPSTFESGERSDRKGHITRQGPSRVRWVLCQAVWHRLRKLDSERAACERIMGGKPKRKKIAVTAGMRWLAIRLWRIALGVLHEGSAPARQKGAAPSASALASP